jgi:hypothetical protein
MRRLRVIGLGLLTRLSRQTSLATRADGKGINLPARDREMF